MIIQNLKEELQNKLGGVCTEIDTSSVQKLRRKLRRVSSMDSVSKMIEDCSEKETIEAIRAHEQTRLRNFLKIKQSLVDYSRRSELSVVNMRKARKTHCSMLIHNQNKKVDIGKKYNTYLSIKMQALLEAQRIQQTRTMMARWQQKTRQNPINSPNVKKMNFLIEKIKEKKDQLSIIAQQLEEPPIHTPPPFLKCASSSKYSSFSTTKSKLW